MPKREDERQRNLRGRHVEACTCQDCTDRFLKKKKITPSRNKPGITRTGGEKIAKHPRDCECASCALLRTMGNLPQLDKGPGGFLKRLFRKK
ncbi:MAG: hypothetical protein O2913_00635 [Chloroflexi bacterium]|nr:hypothetical protein [Chloroflexota bacterium]